MNVSPVAGVTPVRSGSSARRESVGTGGGAPNWQARWDG